MSLELVLAVCAHCAIFVYLFVVFGIDHLSNVPQHLIHCRKYYDNLHMEAKLFLVHIISLYNNATIYE